jgi:hypothetical protein
MYMGFRAHNSLSVCQEELERAVKFTLPPPFYFTAHILLYRPVHRTNKKSTSRWKVHNTRLRYINYILICRCVETGTEGLIYGYGEGKDG